MKRDYFSDSFFQSTRTDQNSSTKVLPNIMVSTWTIWPSELNRKGFSCFPQNKQYWARLTGPPFSLFSALWDFRKKIHKRVPLSKLQQWMLKNPKGSLLLPRQGPSSGPPARQFGSTSGFFGYCKRIIDTLKSFCYIWSLDMAPTYAVPGLFFQFVAFISQNWKKCGYHVPSDDMARI